MDKIIEKYVTNEEIRQLEEQMLSTEELKKLLEEYFKFEIPYYIALDIIEHETYHHICLMINLATVNERISRENAATLKEGIKELFNVKNKCDNVESKLLINKY